MITAAAGILLLMSESASRAEESAVFQRAEAEHKTEPARFEGEGFPKEDGFALVTAVDLRGAVTSSGEGDSGGIPMTLQSFSGSDSMFFRAEDAGDGAVYLRSTGSGLYLAVSDNSPESGTLLTQRSLTGEDSEKWFLESAEDGHYLVVSGLGTVLDLAGGNTEDGTALLLCARNGGLNQEWDILPKGSVPAGMDFRTGRGSNITGAEVPSGKYVITSALDDHMAFGIDGMPAENALLEIRRYTGGESQIFAIAENGDGTYRILSGTEEKYALDIRDASPESGAVLQMRTYDGTEGQRWMLVPVEGYYLIRSVLGTALDVFEERREEGTRVGMFTAAESRNQLWRLFRTG